MFHLSYFNKYTCIGLVVNEIFNIYYILHAKINLKYNVVRKNLKNVISQIFVFRVRVVSEFNDRCRSVLLKLAAEPPYNKAALTTQRLVRAGMKQK